MKKIIFSVFNRISIANANTGLLVAFAALLFVGGSCAAEKNNVMGRPPGIRTSEQENTRTKVPKKDLKKKASISEKKRKKKKGKSHFSEDNIVEWDADVAWSESEDLNVWNTDERNYSPIFEIEGWPYQEAGANFRIIWKGGDAKVAVYNNPTLNESIKEEISFDSGEEIGWTSTHVAVLSPSLYTAKKDIRIEGFDVFSEDFLTGEDGFSKMLKRGASLRLLLYAGDGLCYVGLAGKSIETLCPTPDSFRGSFRGADLREQMQPTSRMWWIELVGREGWIVLDNNYIVEIH